MKSIVFSAVFSAVLVAILANKVQFKDCGSKSGSITSVDIDPCPQFPCPFKRNTTINVVMNFTANAAITSATTKVYGLILGQLVPFPLPNPDACESSVMSCPIKSGDNVTYKNAVFVKPEYPKITLVVEWEVMSGNDVITCFTVPAQIID